MFIGMTIQEFNVSFQTEIECRQYLFDIKWKKRFECRRCGHKKCWKGRTRFHKRCIGCGYDESVTAHTVFHKMQMPLLKAFWIVYQIAVLKKGLSTEDLATINGVDQKTAWRFKNKIQSAMQDWLSSISEINGQKRISSIDGVILTHRDEQLNGLQRTNLVIEQHKSKRSKGRIVKLKSTTPLPDIIDPCHLICGRYVGEAKDIRVWNFRGWLTGTHHHCSEKHLHLYLDEFAFRLNNSNQREYIWHTLIVAMMKFKPRYLTNHAA